jgi:hypothetical protein
MTLSSEIKKLKTLGVFNLLALFALLTHYTGSKRENGPGFGG